MLKVCLVSLGLLAMVGCGKVTPHIAGVDIPPDNNPVASQPVSVTPDSSPVVVAPSDPPVAVHAFSTPAVLTRGQVSQQNTVMSTSPGT